MNITPDKYFNIIQKLALKQSYLNNQEILVNGGNENDFDFKNKVDEDIIASNPVMRESLFAEYLKNHPEELTKETFEALISSDSALEELKFNNVEDKSQIEALFGKNVAKAFSFGSQHSPYHDRDLWEHIIDTIKNVPAKETTMRTAALLHDIAKPEVYVATPAHIEYVATNQIKNIDSIGKDASLENLDKYGINKENTTERYMFMGHAQKSQELASELLDKIGYTGEERKNIEFFIGHHDDFMPIHFNNGIIPEKEISTANKIFEEWTNIGISKENQNKMFLFIDSDCKAQASVAHLYIPFANGKDNITFKNIPSGIPATDFKTHEIKKNPDGSIKYKAASLKKKSFMTLQDKLDKNSALKELFIAKDITHEIAKLDNTKNKEDVEVLIKNAQLNNVAKTLTPEEAIKMINEAKQNNNIEK